MSETATIPKAPSPGEEAFALACRVYGLEPERELRFCPPRRFKFDFAFPELRLAVEIDGGTRTNGRHNRHQGFQNDCEKLNLAAIEGWAVLRFTTDMVMSGKAIETVMEWRDRWSK